MIKKILATVRFVLRYIFLSSKKDNSLAEKHRQPTEVGKEVMHLSKFIQWCCWFRGIKANAHGEESNDQPTDGLKE